MIMIRNTISEIGLEQPRPFTVSFRDILIIAVPEETRYDVGSILFGLASTMQSGSCFLFLLFGCINKPADYFLPLISLYVLCLLLLAC